MIAVGSIAGAIGMAVLFRDGTHVVGCMCMWVVEVVRAQWMDVATKRKSYDKRARRIRVLFTSV
jgi:hypothetical protein